MSEHDDDRTPTLADADAKRQQANEQWANAREWVNSGRAKAAEVAVALAQDLEAEADRLELLARRALMSEAQ